MTESQKKAQAEFDAFLEELCDHIRIAGGNGNPNTYRRMPLEEVFTQLHPNDIILGFRNNRMTSSYRLSKNLR